MILNERPKDGGAYGWCKKCEGFVVALGRHCFNDDSHIVDHLSPQEREELKEDEILEYTWRSDPSKRTPPEPIKQPEPQTKEEESQSMPNQKAFENGDKIKQYRKRFGLNLRDMANYAGVSPSNLQNWEYGKSYPPDSKQPAAKKDEYEKLMAIVEQNEAPVITVPKSKPRVRLKEPKIQNQAPSQPQKKSSLENAITEIVRGIVREEIQKAFRDLANFRDLTKESQSDSK